MSYIRGTYYCWRGGENGKERMHLNDEKSQVAIPLHLFDAIVLMRVAQLLAEDKLDLKKALVEAKKHKGNFGSWALFKIRGEDLKKTFMKRMRDRGTRRRPKGRR